MIQEFNKAAWHFSQKIQTKDKGSLLALSESFPKIYVVALFSADGEKIKSVVGYENADDAFFYSKNGNKHVINNGKFL